MAYSFEVIGSIAILQQKKSMLELKRISRKILEEHKNIRTVLAKRGKIKGRLRKRGLKFIAGIKTFETIHKESNCLIKLNVKTSYFSPRLSNERIEILHQVKNKEKILVLFSGVAPYALVIAKSRKDAEIIAIELNREACRYAEENIKMNKLQNIKIIQGDVKKVLPRLKEAGRKFDRIVMPRPQLKDKFLKEAFLVSKKGTIINYYDFADEEKIKEKVEEMEKEARRYKKKIKILNVKKAGGEIAPRKFRIRADFKVI